MWRRPFVGTWEISLASGPHTGSAYEGNSRTMSMHAGEKSDGCMVPVKPRTKPSSIGGGDGGGTAAGRGEGELRGRSRTQRRIRPVTEAASPRIGAAWVPNPPKADRVRPETGARCGKAARRDLRGGRLATAVPTATLASTPMLWPCGGLRVVIGCGLDNHGLVHARRRRKYYPNVA